jgi:membrane protein YqaA with SNARE-associated domain
MHLADSPQSLVALFLIAFVVSSIFPIPPDVRLIAIVAANQSRWAVAAFACSAGSGLGACLGYLIGYAFMATLGQPIIDFYQAQPQWDRVVDLYNGVWGAWFLAGAAFTPIPFKVATIAAGATEMSFWPFLIISLIGRSARFFIVAVLLRAAGPPVRRTIEQHFDVATLLFLVLLIGGFVVIRFL